MRPDVVPIPRFPSPPRRGSLTYPDGRNDVPRTASQMPTDSDFDSQLAEVAGDPHRRIEALHALLGEGPCRQLGIYPIPDGFKLSVVIPVYNEERWLREIIRRVRAVPIPKEIILVDDCSTDGTR